MSDKVSKILLVDLSHVFWSIALGGELPNSNAPRDLSLNLIRSLCKGYDRTVIATDGKAPSFRTLSWPKYKAKRKERPDQLWRLLADTIRNCEANGYHVFKAPECPDTDGLCFEADDVIGSVVAWCVESGIAVDILTGDSDLAQCVSDANNVRLLRNYKGITPLNEAGIKAWLDITPAQVVELKALAGDSGDGYGDLFPGIGEKTAIKFLSSEKAEWSARKVVELTIASDAKGKTCDTIRSGGLDRIDIGYVLARVVTDVPLPFRSILDAKDTIALPEVGADLIPDATKEGAEPVAIPPGDPTAIHEAELEEPTRAERTPGAPYEPPVSSAMARVDPTARMLISPREAVERLKEFRALIQNCLTRNVDYGKIQGCGDREVLFKPGAEKLAEIYGYAPSFKVEASVEHWDPNAPMFYYRVKCTLKRKADGIKVAECIGSCNSREIKYAGRWVFERDIPGHLDASKLPTRKTKNKQKRSNDDPDMVTQWSIPNPAIFDQVNTFLKMSQKRAMVGAVILATRSGSVFTSDMEDLPEGYMGEDSGKHQWQND